MNKRCARCDKTVYPTEQLNCLDKYWHKMCFKCETCNMTLNMKNYKGYNKLPYCNAHYPTTRHTAIADTPELKRIAENTKNQSSIRYHEEFERSKGNKISVADDPETQRVKKNMETVSNISYHKELERKHNMEMMRPQENDQRNMRRKQPGSISDYDPADTSQSYNTNTGTPYSAKQQSTKVFDSRSGAVENGSSQRRVGSISDYDPMNDRYGSVAGQYSTESEPVQVYQSKLHKVKEEDVPPQLPKSQPPELDSDEPPPLPQSDLPPLVTDTIPLQNDDYDDVPPPIPQSEVPPLDSGEEEEEEGRYEPETDGHPQQYQQPAPPQQYNPPPQQYNPPPQQYNPPPQQYNPPPQQSYRASQGPVYKAMYDYTAADSDEVSFLDGDTIVNVTVIDDGWMEGMVQRTGQSGMLPSNYVERV